MGEEDTGKLSFILFILFIIFISFHSFFQTYVHTYDMYCDVYNQCAYCGNLVEVVIREWQILNSLFVHPLTEKALNFMVHKMKGFNIFHIQQYYESFMNN